MEKREIEMEEKEGLKGKGEREEGCLGQHSGTQQVSGQGGGSSGGQEEVSIAGGLSVFSCSSVFHLLTQL